MAEFPIQYTEATPSGRGRSVRADIDVRTGEQQVGQAISGLGETIFDLGLKWDLKEANTQFSEYKRNVEMSRFERDIEIKKEFDQNKHEAIFKRYDEIQKGFMPTNRRAAQAAGIWNNQQAPIQQQALMDARIFQTKDNERTEVFNFQAEVAAGTKTIEEFETFFARLIKIERDNPDDTPPTFTNLQAAKILADTRKAALIGTVWRQANQLSLEDGINLIKSAKGLTVDEQQALVNDLKFTKETEKIAQKQKDDVIGDEFLSLLINKLDPTKPQLTFDMIVASELSFDAKDEWFTKLRVFNNYSEGELKEAFTDKGEVLADIYDKIDNGTLTDELDIMVGKGLSPITAERIKKEIRVPYEKDTEQLFKRLFGWSPELGFANDMAAFLYEKSLREWQAEVKKQDATGDKIVEIGRAVVKPYFIEHIKRTMPFDEDIPRIIELALGEPEEIEKEVPIIKPAIEKEPPVLPEAKEPEDIAEFERIVARLKAEDMEKAREYYNKWQGKFTAEETKIED